MLAVGVLLAALGATRGLAQQPDQPPLPTAAANQRELNARAAERLRALRQEADALLAKERTLLVELRKLEVERQLQSERLRQLDGEAAALEQELSDTSALISALERTRAGQAPALRARLTELYKLGRAGYVRLLLDVKDMGQATRALRTVSAMAALDRERVRAHTSTRRSLQQTRAALVKRRTELASLREQAAAARAAAARAAAARAALIASIDERRDLNAQLAGELEGAQQNLQHAVTRLGGRGGSALPLTTLRGAIEWPVAPGRIIARFGTARSAFTGAAIVRNGIQIGAPAGSPVVAVHDGVVAHAGPFTGYGTLVIVDHGNRAYSLYGYLASADVARNTRITHGQTIGTVGLAPAGDAALYFELRVDGQPVDPLQWLKVRPSTGIAP